jgi:hypothetical protein
MEIMRREARHDERICGAIAARISDSLAAHDCAVGGQLERDRRTDELGREGTMRQVTRMHRTLTVLAVGLLALAAPLVAYAGDGGPGTG